MHSTCHAPLSKCTQLRSQLPYLQVAGWTGIAFDLHAVDVCDHTRPVVALPSDVLACYVQAEVVHGLSGDEVSTRAALNNCVMQVMLHPYHVSSAVACALGQVDTSNIIEGGRRTRRGGVSSAVQTAGAKPPEVADLSDDEW